MKILAAYFLSHLLNFPKTKPAINRLLRGRCFSQIHGTCPGLLEHQQSRECGCPARGAFHATLEITGPRILPTIFLWHSSWSGPARTTSSLLQREPWVNRELNTVEDVVFERLKNYTRCVSILVIRKCFSNSQTSEIR